MEQGEIQLAAAFRLSASLVMVIDTADGRIVDVNASLERTLGYVRAELVGKLTIDLDLWPDLETRSRIWASLRTEHRVCNQAIEFQARDGRRLRARLQCELLEENGRVLALAIAQEVAAGEADEAQPVDAQSYRSLFLAAAEGIYRSLPQGGLIDANPALARILGYPSPSSLLRELARPSRQMYVNPEHCERLYGQLNGLGVIENVRSEVFRLDGSTIWISENARVVRGTDGRVLFYEGTIIDITAQVEAESALRQSEELYRILVDNCRDGVFLIQGGKVIFINHAMAQMLGYRVDELINSEYMALIAPESHDAQARRRAEREAGSTDLQGYEIFMLCRDGTRRMVEVRAGAVHYNGVIASTGTARDITRDRATRRELAEAERKYRELFEHSVVGLFQTGLDGRLLEVNPAIARMLGHETPAAMLQFVQSMESLYANPDDRARLLGLLEDQHEVQNAELQVRCRDGRFIWVSINAHLVRNGSGEAVYIEGSVYDITQRREAERNLQRSEERYRALVEHSQVGVYVMRNGHYLYVNQAFATLTGFEEAELIGMHWKDLATEEGRRTVDARLERRASGLPVPPDYETVVRRKDGREVWVNVSAGPIQLEDGEYFSGTLRDVTERHRFERELEHNATHDPLTGLPNRVLFERHLTQRIEDSIRAARFDYAVLFLDLDGFKLVNDSLGHAAGDRLLVEIARRLRAQLSDADLLARYGGDEFTILPSADWPLSQTKSLADNLLAVLAEPFQLDGHRIYSGASIGIVNGEARYSTSEQVLRDADTAMYRAKARGKSAFVLFDEAMHAAARQRFRLDTDLRLALERSEFRVYYQPLVDLRSGVICGCEALVRWQHPERGLLLPPEFLQAAEETGLIVPIDWWVMENAAQQLMRWQSELPQFSNLRINVNVDDRQFAERDICAGITDVLARTGLASASLALEVTETVFRSGQGQAQAILREIKALGVTLVVDDFGTGYSSLDSFASSPFDALKVDRSFVRDMETNRRHRAIVRTISNFAEDLGLALTAEGVETPAQAELLLAMGCGTAQGFLYAPALTAADMGAALAAGSMLQKRA
ncbi:MAG: PAS domain S-box protein [Tahibacter sp.]